MILFNLITGFLGSGKTTLLSNLLSELSTTKRIAVIQNEFAPSGVDGKELKHKVPNFKLIEINNGSVFCVCQLNNFVQTLQKLIDSYQPEVIFLEASGLADPISIVELLQMPEINTKVALDRIISLVDIPNFFKGLSTLSRVKHQLMIADKIILNKTDLHQGDLSEITQTIKQLNPFAELIPTSFGKVNWNELALLPANKNKAAAQYIGKESGGRPNITACVLRTSDKISEANLRNFSKEWQPKSPRFKGFLNLEDGRTASIQSVYDSMEITEVPNYMGPSELIVFGNGITVSELRQSFKKFAIR